MAGLLNSSDRVQSSNATRTDDAKHASCGHTHDSKGGHGAAAVEGHWHTPAENKPVDRQPPLKHQKGACNASYCHCRRLAARKVACLSSGSVRVVRKLSAKHAPIPAENDLRVFEHSDPIACFQDHCGQSEAFRIPVCKRKPAVQHARSVGVESRLGLS